jgi:hypothetical protein
VHYGDVAAFTSPKGSGFAHKLTDLKGFGPQAYERFESAQSKFWAEWPGELSQRFAKELGYFPDKPQAKKKKKGKGKPDATVKGGGKRTAGGGGNGRASGGADQPGDAAAVDAEINAEIESAAAAETAA